MMKRISLFLFLFALIGLGSAFAPAKDHETHLILTFENSEGEQYQRDLSFSKPEDWKSTLINAEFIKTGVKLDFEFTCIYAPFEQDAEVVYSSSDESLMRVLNRYLPKLKQGDRLIFDNLYDKSKKNYSSPIILWVK
ncbi:MAG: hypothetical protein LPK45_07805 [Bacteroidota bacterium]|nr:hypothetical protein [Bacteroidota bacterium]MDX5430974.1 hypothetical protein [Bacteroidota bacterium]MDX5469725.1 hypothetical protein [Bacteroidota bacterium]